MTLQLLLTEDNNLICMYDRMWRQKQWNVYSRIYNNISSSETGMCITKLTHYFKALISINGRDKFN